MERLAVGNASQKKQAEETRKMNTLRNEATNPDCKWVTSKKGRNCSHFVLVECKANMAMLAPPDSSSRGCDVAHGKCSVHGSSVQRKDGTNSELLLLPTAAAAERASLGEESTQEPMMVIDPPVVEMETAEERALCWGAI